MLLWIDDPLLTEAYPTGLLNEILQSNLLGSLGIVMVPFNPTAENIAINLIDVIGPRVLKGTGAVLTNVQVDETRKCSATASKYIVVKT